MANEITISTNESDIRSMLIKLMGRGMTLSQKVEGQFVLNLDDIIDLINKIAQRVQLQNHCKMSDFFAVFDFEDGSQESVPSFEALQAYRSVNPTICKSCKLSFAFLIDFHSRGVEKQAVDIELSGEGLSKRKPFYIFLKDDFSLGFLDIRIEYTDVTWANDIKNLFEKYCQTHVQKYAFRHKIAPFFSVRSLPLLAMPFVFLGLLISDAGSSREKVVAKLGDYLHGIPSSDQLALILRKLDVLVYKENDTRSIWDISAPLIVMICFIAVSALASTLVRNVPVSAILVSSEARKVYERQERNRTRSNLYAVLGIFASLAVSVVAANLDRAIMKLVGM